MHDTLEQARRMPLRRVHDTEPAPPPWPAPWQSLHALVAHGWLTRAERLSRRRTRLEEWTITDEGRVALDPPPVIRQARPLYLAAKPQHIRADYTRNPARALLSAGEVLDDPESVWAAEAAQRHAGAGDRRARARQLAHNARAG
jgi:hypothetical protein